jgi:hypothetical protein
VKQIPTLPVAFATTVTRAEEMEKEVAPGEGTRYILSAQWKTACKIWKWGHMCWVSIVIIDNFIYNLIETREISCARESLLASTE